MTFIAAAGVPVLREGNVLQLPARTLEVAEACSGIRSLVSLTMLGIAPWLFHRTAAARARGGWPSRRCPSRSSRTPARVAGTGLASEWISRAAADGFFHTFSGWLMFVVAFASLVLVQRVMSRARSWTPRWRRTALEAG